LPNKSSLKYALGDVVLSAPSLARPKTMSSLWEFGDKVLSAPSLGMTRQIYTLDGRFSLEDTETVLKTLREFDPEGKGATIEVTKTFTEVLVDMVRNAAKVQG
jgi:hypothetical protein